MANPQSKDNVGKTLPRNTASKEHRFEERKISINPIDDSDNVNTKNSMMTATVKSPSQLKVSKNITKTEKKSAWEEVKQKKEKITEKSSKKQHLSTYLPKASLTDQQGSDVTSVTSSDQQENLDSSIQSVSTLSKQPSSLNTIYSRSYKSLSRIFSFKRWQSRPSLSSRMSDRSGAQSEKIPKIKRETLKTCRSGPEENLKRDLPNKLSSPEDKIQDKKPKSKLMAKSSRTLSSMTLSEGNTASSSSIRLNEKLVLLQRLAQIHDSENIFYNNDDHLIFCRSVKQNITSNIPEPLVNTIKLEVFPILVVSKII